MNDSTWDQIAGKWKQFRGRITEKWGELTDDEVDEINGRRDVLAGKIQEKYGIAREEANRQIDEWAEEIRV